MKITGFCLVYWPQYLATGIVDFGVPLSTGQRRSYLRSALLEEFLLRLYMLRRLGFCFVLLFVSRHHFVCLFISVYNYCVWEFKFYYWRFVCVCVIMWFYKVGTVNNHYYVPVHRPVHQPQLLVGKVTIYTYTNKV